MASAVWSSSSGLAVLLAIQCIFSGANALVPRPSSPPGRLPEHWSYKGCFEYSNDQHTLLKLRTSSQDQNANTCIALCAKNGYVLAGTGNQHQCICSNFVGSEIALASQSCSFPCSGDRTEACGGQNKLSVYERSVPVVVVRAVTSSSSSSSSSNVRLSLSKTNSTSNRASSTSSWSSSTSSRSSSVSSRLTSTSNVSPSRFSSSRATLGSSSNSLSSSPVSSGRLVSSSSMIVASSVVVSSYTSASKSISTVSNSAVPSSSLLNASQAASSRAISISSTVSFTSSVITSSFNTTRTTFSTPISSSDQFSSTTPVASSPPSGNGTVPKIGWYPEGCYTDDVAGRTLSVGGTVNGAMTNAKCRDACQAAGFLLAGTEYSGECYCDNQIRNAGSPAPDGDVGCNMPCNGNQTEFCGGASRLTLFKYYTDGTGSPTATISTSFTSRSTVVPTGIPTGFAYKGCYVDGPGFRILNNQQPDNQGMTVASCVSRCAAAGYTIAGMEYSYQCFCDNYVRMGAIPAISENECSTSCAGDPSQKCGGPDRVSVWSNQTTLNIIQKPKPVQTVGSWTYQGCITDGGAGQKVFPWQLVNVTGNSPEWCLTKCQEFGYMAAGMEYGEECYCGDLDGIEQQNSQQVAESECSTACPGNPEAICGQGSRLSWYRWTGTPLYVWQYPQGTAAGRYEFLVGGPVIPLIAQPGINGKISLLEKHGTGPPNSTGAYELDPSLSGDISRAFRELQGIKTDIFCAAGLTLPDRVGRQINIGGWSADSLFGVRAYWPDGQLGVNGTNDWQEDVSSVSLQRGRWYPTGLVMANGSLLIVGGQDGSNGAPVNSLEILPKVGPVLNLPYMNTTDIVSYPYLVVLPSGGIFIQSLNESRILDEKTLLPLKVLPPVPASVNDPTGGRTYPLEGTQVLLPQYYPYTDPLQILLCGGAHRTPARWGIDNCVSIAPDIPNPKWTIERMPSRRVLSCMATLPDGTFLILNGAMTGEGGFGLADNPNYNAILYDPSRPLHQRMSIMENTTIARLYHSEAVLMDDGRVLVSGSDPQDQKHPQEYRYEVFLPPYLLSGLTPPAFQIGQRDWIWEATYSFTLTTSPRGMVRVSLLGSESSTHGSSMGARVLFPLVSCSGLVCTVRAPKGPYIAPVGWYRMFVLDGPRPSHATWVRIGGDPASLGNWPNVPAFQPLPGIGSIEPLTSTSLFTNTTVVRGL